MSVHFALLSDFGGRERIEIYELLQRNFNATLALCFFFSFLIGLYRFFPACTARHRVPFVRIHRDGRSWVTPADFSERLETAGPRRARGAGAQVRDGGEREAGRAGAEPGGGGGRGAERGRARPAPLRASRAAGPA